jgi:CRISPR/Cas system-associated protein Cas10 (large subunit of type III CRISPR-Cas system)
MNLVTDPHHNHACDWCGDHIKAGEQHYAKPDGTYILCSICGVTEAQHEVPHRLP